MKRAGIVIFLSMLCNVLCAQTDFALIKGNVYQKRTYEKDSLMVQNAEIILQINDSLKLMTLSDNDGQYEFRIKKFKGSVKLFCNITRSSTVKGKKNACLFSSNDIRIINLDPARNVIYLAYFESQQGCCLPRMPTLYFKTNTTEFNKDSIINEHETRDFVKFLLDLLSDNPSMVIEVAGHCDKKEKNKQELTLNRAEVVRKILLDSGVVKERVKVIGKSDKNLYTFLGNPKSKEEKEFASMRNQRIDFRILNFEYGVQPSNKPVDDGEE